MRTVTLALVALVALSAGCDKTKRLSSTEMDHFYALKVYMSEDEEKTFLKYKTEAERSAYLKELGHWDRFYQFDERKREDILAGDVKVGWEEAAVYMAWGAPFRKLAATGRRAELSEILRYRFEIDPYGDVVVWTPKSKTEHSAAILYQVDVTVDDGRVARMVRTDCVPNWNFCNEVKWEKGN